MGRIAILPDPVADQIAAGEVVERPASVVKELVENALDAGAAHVDIAIETGGKASITVSDDGMGMDRDDAVLSIDRHATSKIQRASDLIGVATYGFRGEALPSIASISKFVIETAPRERDGTGEATRIVVEGGVLKAVEAVARQGGTTVEVKRLFFNTPARRKFLRSTAAESRAVSAAVALLALTRLDVTFSLTSDGRVLIDAPRVAAFGDRVATLFGREVAEGLIPVEHHAGAVTVRGFIQRPADARPAGRKAFLFVNGRPFRDHFLVRSAEAGYRGTIHPGARPSMFLTVAVPGDAVDVNVHPMKQEVRFRDRFLLERTFEEAVASALGQLDSAAVVHRPGWEGRDPSSAVPWRPAPSSAADAIAPPELFAPLGDEGEGSEREPVSGTVPVGEAFLQVFQTYIVMPTPDGLALIDQHSAHERILYEEVMGVLAGDGASAQRLLLPLTIDLEASELDAIEEHRESIGRIGFEVEPFGGRSVVVHAVPNPHPRFDARRCFEEMAADLARGRFGGWANQLERFAATYACRAAVKAGQTLDAREIRTLLARLFACRLPPHDVHGRPTIVQLPKDELERRFGRG